MSAPMTRSTPMSGNAIHARSPAWGTPGTPFRAMQRASLCASPTNSACPVKTQDETASAMGYRLGASQREGVAAVVAWRIAGRMLREDRDGTTSLIEVEDRHPVVGDQFLELPGETLEEPARVELG